MSTAVRRRASAAGDAAAAPLCLENTTCSTQHLGCSTLRCGALRHRTSAAGDATDPRILRTQQHAVQHLGCGTPRNATPPHLCGRCRRLRVEHLGQRLLHLCDLGRKAGGRDGRVGELTRLIWRMQWSRCPGSSSGLGVRWPRSIKRSGRSSDLVDEVIWSMK